MKIALLQLNFLIGDIDGNAKKMIAAAKQAFSQGADLCVSSELALIGYPPRDLLLIEGMVERCWNAAEGMAKELGKAGPVLVGLPERSTSPVGPPLYNAVALLKDGKVGQCFRKALLPTYDVFDEARYFEPYQGNAPLELCGKRIGVTICEDLWNHDSVPLDRSYSWTPIKEVAAAKCDLLINISASPYSAEKQALRERLFSIQAKQYNMPILYVNQVGGNDELLFDGFSCAINADGETRSRAPGFAEAALLVDMGNDGQGNLAPLPDCVEQEIWSALTLGLRDYVGKCGFNNVVIGLSGGIDSGLTAAIAADALGPEAVTGVLMPSPYTSKASIDDALELAGNLGMKTETLPIAQLMDGYANILQGQFQGQAADTTEENIQARIRGNLLMAISNKFHALVLSTGNKSELSVGYCTLYGDLSGGLALISDVPKTMVYRLCRWANKRAGRELIPENMITKAPTAELKPDQKDQDSLPPYDELDEILHLLVERMQPMDAIIKAGHDPETVKKVFHLVRIAEFKRRQAPPCLKVTTRAFGMGRRMPIACRLG